MLQIAICTSEPERYVRELREGRGVKELQTSTQVLVCCPCMSGGPEDAARWYCPEGGSYHCLCTAVSKGFSSFALFLPNLIRYIDNTLPSHLHTRALATQSCLDLISQRSHRYARIRSTFR
ncbi:unnamed protein product [Sympodiomycopsis kandeliae]